MMMKSVVQQLEANATHIVLTFETDLVTGEQRLVHFFHAVAGDVTSAFAKAEAAASDEVAKIEADAKAARVKVGERMAAIKAALGL